MHALWLVSWTLLSAPLDAPVSAVTVYSDRARVTRTANVTLNGAQKLELPPLLDAVDPSSIRVEAQGATVRRVDLAPLAEDELPVDETKKLLSQLEQVSDQLSRVEAERDAWARQRAALARVSPQLPSENAQQPLPKLSGGGWGSAMSYLGDATAQAQAKERELTAAADDLRRQYAKLLEQARLLGATSRRVGWRVTPWVDGSGPAKLTLTYLSARARWQPVYDLQLNSDTGKVQVSFAGLVSQETGEDWTDAALTLSTAIPATATRFPDLPAWKIGERDRFVPTPVAEPDWVRPPPSAPALPASLREQDVLRRRLVSFVGGDATGGEVAALSYSRQTTLDFSDDTVEGELTKPDGEYLQEKKKSLRKDSVTRDAREQAKQWAGKSRARAAEAPAPPPAPMAPMAMPAESAPAATGSTRGARSESVSLSSLGGLSRGEASSFSLAPPGVWRPPSYGADAPATLAGGYDLSFAALRSETVPSGKGARRVALFSESWPVTVERKVFPALAQEAFLVAELKSPAKQVLPGGTAQLFVGDDPAGTARLSLVSPGEAFTLPLGLDRAIRPVRNVQVKQSERGFIGKEEVAEYVTSIELANPYRQPIAMRVIDQWPVTDDKNVEVKLVETKPAATATDKVKGQLEWKLTVPAQSKTKVSFTYTLRRPKGWRMHQQ